MNYSVIIAEFNPLTLGHEKLIRKTKEMFPDDGIIVIMSGNFVQRGEPAILDKFERARAAVELGVDAVIELPLIYSISSADDFGFGGVAIANLIPNAKRIVFGSESGDINKLKAAQKELESPQVTKIIKENLKTGLSYATSTITATKSVANDILSSPNNMLGITYLKALKKANSGLDAITIKREDNYNDTSLSALPSASALRQSIKDEKLDEIVGKIPNAMLEKINYLKTPNSNILFPIIFYKLESLTPSNLSDFAGISEGLEHSLKKKILLAKNYDDLVDSLSSKRYPKSKIRRILLNILFNIKKEDKINQHANPYLKVLAAKTKNTVLKDLASANIPLITQSKDYFSAPSNIKPILQRELLADNIYALITNSKKNSALKNRL